MGVDVDVKKVGNILNDSTAPLSKRFRALFMLRNVGGDEAVCEITRCFVDESDLLNHELAYCLGQMRNKTAIPKLSELLANTDLAPILRHEAGEALGAIGDKSSLLLLKQFSTDCVQEVAETCHLAVERIEWLQKDSNSDPLIPSPFASVDPTPSLPASEKSVNHLENVLLDKSEPLYKRYRAMFSLRNLHTDEAALALTKGLFCSDSALFRHEVAYVLGQMQLSVTVPALLKSLTNSNENSMVRHESAEALGSIADESCLDALRKHLSDPSRVVRESCEVALDMYKYETEEFNYSIDNGVKN